MSRPGLRVNAAPTPAPHSLIQDLSQVVTPHISDNLSRHVGVVGLNRYNRSGKLIGTALTVKTRPGDNLYIYKALTMVQPGHVLVIDAGGDFNNAVIGELIKLYAIQRGCVGFVVDGSIRDVASFEDFPCYARNVVHRGPYKDGPGEVNVPVCIGGQVINPGDILLGDEDGLVCFAPEHADELIGLAAKHMAHEERIKAEIATGSVEQSWLTKVLESKGLLG